MSCLSIQGNNCSLFLFSHLSMHFTLRDTIFNLWAQIPDWVDNISSSFYISPFFLRSPFLWIILSTHVHTCHVYQFREITVPIPVFHTWACTLPWETQNENKISQTSPLSKLIIMHSVLVSPLHSEKVVHAVICSCKFKSTKYWSKYSESLAQISGATYP